MARSVRTGFLTFAGIGLVVVGAILLADRLFAPILRPLAGVLHAVGVVAWPLALIGVGVVLITASRHAQTGAKLYRSRTDRVIGGVLGGIAIRWGLPANFVRVLFVVLAVLTSGFAAVLFYLLALAFIPEEPAGVFDATPAPPAPPIPPAPSIPTAPVAPPVPEQVTATVAP